MAWRYYYEKECYMKRIIATIMCLVLAVGTLTMLVGCENEEQAKTTEKYNVNDLNCMVDLHLHLDGAISLNSAKILAKEQGIEIPENDAEILELLQIRKDCPDLNEFLTKFDFPCSLLQTTKGIKIALQNLTKELDEQGVMYAEIRFAPQLLTSKGLTQEQVVKAAIEGIEDSPIGIGLILCCMRGSDNKEANLETVDLVAKYADEGVSAVDLAGAEALYPTENFKYIHDRANQLGVKSTIHAGEAAGPGSVRQALKFNPNRIGHGIWSEKDDELMDTLAKNQIPLELCPTSNVCTNIYASIADYPIRKLMDRGVIVTVNTDDPSIEGTTIKNEYNQLIEETGLTKDEVKTLLVNSVRQSFADKDLKQLMLLKIEGNFAE